MKPRKLIVTIEMKTDIPVKHLKAKDFWGLVGEIIQIQVNVIKAKK